jgi:excisionase family DNA binding protein
MSERLQRTRDVADLLDVSCETVLRWHRSGKLPGGLRLGSNVLRFDRGELEAWLEGTRANTRLTGVGPAIDAAGVTKPARIYDLRSTFASNALAAGITVYELARIMGTSVSMIEAHYGALLDSAHESLLDRLETYAPPQETTKEVPA